jgi:hypothetical protein
MFRKNIWLVGSIILILGAIAVVSILNQNSSSSSTDVRARAALNKTLELHGIVSSVNEAQGTMVVSDAFFADVSRAGDMKNLGTWTVTAPPAVNLASFTPGMSVLIGIDSKTFLATKHTVTAVSIVRAAK